MNISILILYKFFSDFTISSADYSEQVPKNQNRSIKITQFYFVAEFVSNTVIGIRLVSIDSVVYVFRLVF